MKENIKKLVSQNQTSEAISLLLDYSKSNPELYDSILIVSGEFKDFSMQRLRGTLTNDEVLRRQNLINEKVLIALDSFREDGSPLPSGVNSQKEKSAMLFKRWGIILIVVGVILMAGGIPLFSIFENSDVGNLTQGAGFLCAIAGLGCLGIWLLTVFLTAVKD